MKPFFASLFAVAASVAQADDMKLAVTTSFQNSGLAEILLPAIEEDIAIDVQLLAVGTGQALRLGEAGDVDAILVHSRTAEEAFVAAGYGTHRTEIMYNDFVLIGPESDPADVQSEDTIGAALLAISELQAPFVSRGDDSGTHQMELARWADIGIDPRGDWYRPVGAGMGAALNTAAGMGAYILSDRASWLNFGNKGDLAVVFAGDPVLFNQYAYIPVSPDRHPTVRNDLAMQLEDWLTSDRAQELIDGYEIDGQQLFTFNAGDTAE